MKNCYLLWLVCFLLCLTACSLTIPSSKTINFNDTTYRSDFYGDLFRTDFQPASSSVTIDGQVYHHFTEGPFDYLFDTRSVNEIAYCSEKQWNEAKVYYENPDHFTYYCLSGNLFDSTDHSVHELSGFDPDMLTSLLEFAAKNRYNPFSASQNPSVRRVPMPDPNNWTDYEFRFYKVSKDGLFISTREDIFQIIDKKLVLIYYYDFKHEDTPELCVVDVPVNISNYFINLVTTIQ